MRIFLVISSFIVFLLFSLILWASYQSGKVAQRFSDINQKHQRLEKIDSLKRELDSLHNDYENYKIMSLKTIDSLHVGDTLAYYRFIGWQLSKQYNGNGNLLMQIGPHYAKNGPIVFNIDDNYITK